MAALVDLYDDNKRSLTVENANRQSSALRNHPHPALPLQIRRRLEHAVLQSEQSTARAVEWPSLPFPIGHGAHFTGSNNILRLTLRSAIDASSLSEAAPAFVAADATDAWLLSLLVYHWRTSPLFQPIREECDVSSYRLEQAAQFLRGLLSEHRGSSSRAADDADAPPTLRTVRLLIHSRGEALATLLRGV